jgi:hypothetical protein
MQKQMKKKKKKMKDKKNSWLDLPKSLQASKLKNIIMGRSCTWAS